MNSSIGRFFLIAIGIIAVIVGGVFAGQGANLIPGSVMTGDRMWLYIGIVVAIVGIILIVLGAQRRRRGGGE